MADFDAFPITQKWTPQHPDRLQLYSLTTPNGVKVSIMLEDRFTNMRRVLQAFLERPAVILGLDIPKRP